MPGSATVIGRVAVKVVPDTGDFRGQAQRELSTIEKELDKLNIGFSAKVEQAVSEVQDALTEGQRRANRGAIDLSFATKGAETVKREIKEIKDQAGNIDANVHVDLNNLEYRRIQARMALLARTRIAEIVPEVNEAAAAKAKATLLALSGGRAFGDIGHDFGEWLGNLDKAVPKIGAASLAIANLSSLALTSVSNLSAFGGSLATIGGASLALPGIMGGLAIGVTAFAVAIKDFNKYVPNFAIGLGKSVKAGEAWKHLQDQMSSGFWESAAKPVRELIGTLFPQFSKGMIQTSTELGHWTASIATSMKGVFNGELGSMFDDLSKSIHIAGNHTTSLVDIVRRLGQVGAGELPALAHWFGHLTDDFDGWLAHKGKAGLQGFVDTGVQALQDLGHVLSGAGSALAGLYHAASAGGGSSLAMVGDTLHSVADAINSIHGQRELTQTFAAAHAGIAALTGAAGKDAEDFLQRFANTLQNVLPKAGHAAGNALGAIFNGLDQPAVQRAVEGLFSGLNKVVHNLAPSMPAVGQALAGIADVVRHLAVNLSESLAPALDVVAPAITGLSRDIQPLVEQLGTLLTNGVELVGPGFKELADIAGVLAQNLAAILAPINDLLGAFNSLGGGTDDVTGKLIAIGVLVGGAMWLGAGVRAKVASFGQSVTLAGDQATIASGAFYKAGTAAQGIATRMSGVRLGIAGAALAVGSMVQASGDGSTALGVLGGAAEGVALGSFGGPWGMAIGGAAGALYGLATASHHVAHEFKASGPVASNYASTLDTVTGAATRATRQMALQQALQDGMASKARTVGVSIRDIVNASLGQKSALDRVNTALAKQTSFTVSWTDSMGVTSVASAKTKHEVDKLTKSILAQGGTINDTSNAMDKATRSDILTFIGEQKDAWRSATQETRNNIKATEDLSSLEHKLPKRVFTKIDATGIAPTVRGIAHVADKYHLLPKKVEAVIHALGVDYSVKQVERVLAKMHAADKAKANPKVNVQTKHTEVDIDKVKNKVSDLNKVKGVSEVQVNDKATKPLGEIRQRLTAYTKVVARAQVDIIDHATAKLNAIRSNLQSLNGDTATITTVHQDVFSTSRKSGGPQSGSGSGASAGRGITIPVHMDAAEVADEALKAAKQFTDKLRNAMQQQRNKVDNTFTQLLREAGKKGAAALRKEFGSRVNLVDDMDKRFNDLLSRLDKATTKLSALRDSLKQFRAGVVDSFNATADPTQIGATTYDGIVRGMQLAKEHSARFTDAIHKLIKAGLNKTTLKQLIAAGPEAGLAQAEAIAAGGVGKINKLQKQIAKSGQAVAKEAGNSVFGDLIGAAAAQVNHLTKELRPLEEKLRQAARSLIGALTDELKKELKKADPTPKKKKPASGSGGGATKSSSRAAIPTSVDDVPNGSKVVNKTLNYYAAPNNSLDSEESLFDALGKARGGWL